MQAVVVLGEAENMETSWMVTLIQGQMRPRALMSLPVHAGAMCFGPESLDALCQGRSTRGGGP